MGKTSDPKRSEGARMERESMRRYLRRRLGRGGNEYYRLALEHALEWVMTRRKRYDKQAGGIGR